MDNFDTESNHSYQSDSLQSNASSLSGLSFYGNEFAELQHLIDPSKYPSSYLDRSSTPKAEFPIFGNEEQVNTLKANLQKSLQLNEQYKNDLQNLEKEIEFKFYNKIDKLLGNNTRLEGELENANNQIKRIIKSYKEKNEFLVTKEKLDLEKQIHQLTSTNSNLKIECVNLNHEKYELDVENRNLKINLGELLTEKEIKNASIQDLKHKISEQHIELQNCRTSNSVLLNKLTILNTKLQHCGKSRDWYQNELHQCQNSVQTLKEEIYKHKNQITFLNQNVSSLNIEISKYKNSIDQVRLQALKEKEILFKKLENINLNCNSLNTPSYVVDSTTAFNVNGFSESNVSFYQLTIEDLKGELSRIKVTIQEREQEFEKLKQENCELIAKCLVLQKSLQQNETSIELFENIKRELVKNLGYLKESEKKKLKENFQLKSTITGLETEIKMRIEEKQSVEKTIGVIRDQFLKFKETHEKVKSDVNLKNKEILQLQHEKQELFMSNNWTICELEKVKKKDTIIDNLKRDIVKFETHIAERTHKIRDLEFQILRNGRAIDEKQKMISEKEKELENHNTVIIQYKALTLDYEDKINCLQINLKAVEAEKNELEDNFKIFKGELNKKDLNLDQALKTVESLQNDHKNVLENISIDNKRMFDDYKALEEKYCSKLQEKDACITNLNNNFRKLENDCENYIKTITDDQKAEMFLYHKNTSQNGAKNAFDFKEDLNGSKILNNNFNVPLFPPNSNLNKVIMNFFDNINMEELESTVEIRLKYLDEKLQKIKTGCEEKMEKIKNRHGKDKIKELEILLQVKDRDMEDKQKKMNRNNRALLRKVKEHMRGRNSAEKQLKYLQELYNSLSDEYNTLKLSISSKEYKIQTFEKLCENYNNECDKLRNTVLNLEKNLSKNKTCEKCLEVDLLKEKLFIFEELQEQNCQLKKKDRCSEDNIIQLTKKVKELETHTKSLQEKISSLSRKTEEYNALLTTLKDFEIKETKQNDLVQELSQKLTEKTEICLTNCDIIEGLKEELEQAKENIRSLSGEMKILSSNLQQKVEYSEELLQNNAKLETDFYSKSTENQNVIADLKKSLVLLQNENEYLKNDKLFLQRLSNDLKVALQSYVEYNKNMKEQLNLMAKEKQPFNSLPPNIPEDIAISGKYDEKYIKQLLEENRVPVKNPLTTEIQDCLGKLREEISSLQDQIIKKNNVCN